MFSKDGNEISKGYKIKREPAILRHFTVQLDRKYNRREQTLLSFLFSIFLLSFNCCVVADCCPASSNPVYPVQKKVQIFSSFLPFPGLLVF